MCDLRSGPRRTPLVRVLRFGIRYDRRQLNRFLIRRVPHWGTRVDD